MCVDLEEWDLIKSIEEDLGESHALRRRICPVTGAKLCILLEVQPHVKHYCFTSKYRCHNDFCRFSVSGYTESDDFEAPDFHKFSRAVYSDHDFRFLAQTSEPYQRIYRWASHDERRVNAAYCAVCHQMFEDDDENCALSKRKIL